MAITAAQFKAIFPEFAAEPDARCDVFLAQALRRINTAAFGVYADDAHGYLTAHLISGANSGAAFAAGASGPIVSETVGSLSRSYSVTATTFDRTTILKTPYGEQYMAILRIVEPGIALAW